MKLSYRVFSVVVIKEETSLSNSTTGFQKVQTFEFIIKLNVQSLKVLYDFAFKFVGGINAARCCMFSNSQENIENQPFFANQ